MVPAMALEFRTLLRVLCLCLVLASSVGMLPLYPRPALYDMQLTSSIRVSVEFRGIVQDVHTTFTFRPHSRCVKGESYNYSVLLWQDGSSQPFHVEGPFLVTSCKNTLDLTVHGLRKSQHYTAAVVAYNDHISLRSKRVDVYTTAVQAVEVVEGEECMFITCYFAPGSTAQGCQVQMKIVASHSSQHLHSWQFNISQDPSILMGTLHLPLEPRTTALDVAVYDLSASGRVGYLSIPPHVSHSSGLNCDLGETLTPLRAKAKMVLFYISASFFILGLIIICGGMLCKIGRLHRHFRNKSYEILEGRDPPLHTSSTLNEDERPSKNPRHLTHPQPDSHQPFDTASPGSSSSFKPRAKTYGSYDALGNPTARLLLNQGTGEGGGGGGGTKWGGSIRELADRDTVTVSLHSQPEGKENGAPEVSTGHTTVREGEMNPE